MRKKDQFELLPSVSDLELTRWLIADLHDDLFGKVARFRQLMDISTGLGAAGTLLSGGEITYTAWVEARTSFIHGNYVATVMLCQGLAENLLASHLAISLSGEKLPERIQFGETLERCVAKKIITSKDTDDLRRLMNLRNPLSHYRDIADPSNLSRRVLNTMQSAESHLFSDASFAIGVAIKLLALPTFRLDK